MTNIRFTATTGSQDTYLFRNEDDFLVYLDSLWQTHSWNTYGRRFEAKRLWDKEPKSYPCLMLTSGTMPRRDGPDWVFNHYLYDVEIIDGESENAWQFEDDEAA